MEKLDQNRAVSLAALPLVYLKQDIQQRLILENLNV